MEIKGVINQFKSSGALLIHDVKKAFETPSIQHNLNLIYTHFSKIPELITSLESRNLLLHNSLKVMEELLTTMSELPDVFSEKIRKKITRLLKENLGYDSLNMIDTYINGTSTVLHNTITGNMASKFKYCPVMSCDVERSFSAFKFILNDKRHSFTMDHLEQHFVIYCYENYNSFK
jgi:hypothetical protein